MVDGIYFIKLGLFFLKTGASNLLSLHKTFVLDPSRKHIPYSILHCTILFKSTILVENSVQKNLHHFHTFYRK